MCFRADRFFNYMCCSKGPFSLQWSFLSKRHLITDCSILNLVYKAEANAEAFPKSQRCSKITSQYDFHLKTGLQLRSSIMHNCRRQVTKMV